MNKCVKGKPSKKYLDMKFAILLPLVFKPKSVKHQIY